MKKNPIIVEGTKKRLQVLAGLLKEEDVKETSYSQEDLDYIEGQIKTKDLEALSPLLSSIVGTLYQEDFYPDEIEEYLILKVKETINAVAK